MEANGEKKWRLSVTIAIAATILLAVSMVAPGSATQTQNSSNDIDVVPIQLGRDSYGIVMVDKIAKTMWIYEIGSRGPAHNKLRLLAARSWKYDRQLTDFNTGEPKPEQVKKLLERLAKPEPKMQMEPQLKEELEQEAQPENL